MKTIPFKQRLHKEAISMLVTDGASVIDIHCTSYANPIWILIERLINEQSDIKYIEECYKILDSIVKQLRTIKSNDEPFLKQFIDDLWEFNHMFEKPIPKRKKATLKKKEPLKSGFHKGKNGKVEIWSEGKIIGMQG